MPDAVGLQLLRERALLVYVTSPAVAERLVDGGAPPGQIGLIFAKSMPALWQAYIITR
jgi:hypothetical protein